MSTFFDKTAKSFRSTLVSHAQSFRKQIQIETALDIDGIPGWSKREAAVTHLRSSSTDFYPFCAEFKIVFDFDKCSVGWTVQHSDAVATMPGNGGIAIPRRGHEGHTRQHCKT